ALSQHSLSHYRPCHAAYVLKKLRGKQIVHRINRTRRYQPLPEGLRAITALFVLTNKAINPCSPPLNRSDRTAEHKTHKRSTRTTSPADSPCEACLTNSEWLPEYRKYFFEGHPQGPSPDYS